MSTLWHEYGLKWFAFSLLVIVIGLAGCISVQRYYPAGQTKGKIAQIFRIEGFTVKEQDIIEQDAAALKECRDKPSVGTYQKVSLVTVTRSDLMTENIEYWFCETEYGYKPFIKDIRVTQNRD